MRSQTIIAALVMIAVSLGSAQVASHAPTLGAPTRLMESTRPEVGDKPVARVNGAVLTDRDLLREMYAIFPYGRQHNGFPKGMEAGIRQGALQMIIFEELVYQEAVRRRMEIPAERISRDMAAYRKQFASPDEYRQYLRQECKGSAQVLRQKIRRSLLIEALLKAEVNDKAGISLTAAKAYYDKNPQQFQRRETFHIQTISIIPPANAKLEIQKEARQRAEDALRQANAAKSYREFGLLAEKLSDDDWHVNMGDRRPQEAAALPPPIVEAARKMKPGDVSGLFQFGSNYTLFRLNAYTPGRKVSFQEAKGQVRIDLQKTKVSQLRSDLDQRLQKSAKVEIL
ncbi:MAG: peptidylprolyl isomerase [Acidobacteriia bacterium]|nr:peptidylprolyl isomerase [Terriglobia bacterium]